ncbi:MAG: glycosyltransferase [Candidatus Paceibacterota bacterium]|jgi:glycosyltransferase involved in cell wall biosynthesis
MRTYSFILREVINCGAVLSTFELCQALNRLGHTAVIVSDYNNPELEKYFSVNIIRAPIGITIAVSPKCEGDFAYVRTKDERWLNHKSKKIAVSQYIADWLKENGQESVVISNGTHERFYNMGIERDIDILLAGNYEDTKNIVATIERAKQIGAGKRIVWFGRHTVCGEEYENITNPSLDEIPRLYNRAKTFLSMSKDEGWGRPVAEAMACGVPNVVNLNGGNRDVGVVSWENIANKFIENIC